MGFSKYPNEVDDSTTLPPSTDLITPVKAEVVNRLRDAILAIEQELGAAPSSSFGTVRARLDSLSAELELITLSLGSTGSDVSEISGLISDLQTLLTSVEGSLASHLLDTSNPHDVTAAQVGAVPLVGSTDNVVARFNGTSGAIKNSVNGPFATDAGRLGIGTSSPATELEVAGTTTTTDANVTNTTTTANANVTSHIRLTERVGDPTNVSNNGFLYTKDDGSSTELFFQNDSGFATQITRDGSINGYLNVRDFGAVTDVLGGGDAIQDAIDAMINDQDKYLGILIPPGLYSITRPLIIAKSAGFIRVSLVSSGKFSVNSAGFGGCVIRLDGDGYQDWPVLIVQGGRACQFEGITFLNTGNTAPYDNFASAGIGAHFVFPDRDDWIEAGTRSNSRSPNCCVAIDPFTDGYPGLDIANAYPGLEDYYGGPALPVPRGSSCTIFDHCAFWGAFVGVASSPPGNVGASDVIHNNENNLFNHCSWLYNTYHYASGQNQERGNTLRECTAAAAWCTISTEVVGPGGNPGNCPDIFGMNVGLCKYLFDINASNNPTITNIYFESLVSLGKIGVGVSGVQGGLKIDGIHGAFFTAESTGVPNLPEVPYHLNSWGMVTLENATFNTSSGVDNFFRFWNSTGKLILKSFRAVIVSKIDDNHVPIAFEELYNVSGGPWQTINPGIGAIYHDDPISEIELGTLSGDPIVTVVAVPGDESSGTIALSSTAGIEIGDILKINNNSPTGFTPQVITPTEFAYSYLGPIAIVSDITLDTSITITDLPYGWAFGSSFRFGKVRWINWYPSLTTITSGFRFFFDSIYEVTESDDSSAEDQDIIATWSSQDVDGRQLVQEDATADYPIYDSDVTIINHQPALLFDSVDGYHLTFNGAKSVTNFLHNGVGGTISIGFIHTDAGAGTLFTTLSGSDSNIGLEAVTDGYGNVEVSCGRGSSGYVFNENVLGVLNDGYFHVLTIRHQTSSSPQFDIRVDGTSVASGSYSNAASSSDSTEDLTVGAYPDGSLGFGSHIYAILGSATYIGDSIIARFEDRLFNRVGQ